MLPNEQSTSWMSRCLERVSKLFSPAPQENASLDNWAEQVVSEELARPYRPAI